MDAEVLIWLARGYLVVSGLVIAGHFHCAANFLTEAPHYVKAIIMPGVVACGVGMAVSGFWGYMEFGAICGALAAGFMAALNMVAWGTGLYISSQISLAYKIKRDTKKWLMEFETHASEMASYLKRDQRDKAHHDL